MCAMKRSAVPALTALVVALAVAAPAASASSPVASASGTCNVRNVGASLGPTYTTSLKASGTGCAAAKAVVKAYDACRKSSGGVRGRCRRTVRGLRCKEGRRLSIPTQFMTAVTCSGGSKSVRFTYTQYT
jgi:hypothetical protein